MSYAFFASVLISILLTCLIVQAEAFGGNDSIGNEALYLSMPSQLNSEQNILLKKEKAMKDAMNFAASFAGGNFLRNLRSEDSWNISSQCYSQLLMTADAVREGKTWALKLIDASGKAPRGIFNWRLTDFGDFDGCLAINVSNLFQGKYCIAKVGPPKLQTHGVGSDPKIENAADEEMVRDIFAREMFVFYLRISVCLPSTCSSEDISFIARKILKDNQVNMDAHVTNCQVKERLKLETGDYISIVAIGLMLLMVVAGSLTDLFLMHQTQGKSHRQNSRPLVRCILCFSISWNTENLLKENKSSNSIKFFYGMKVITSLWVILGHVYLFVAFSILGDDSMLLQHMRSGFLFQVVDNPFPIVGVFFFISGSLVVYGRMTMKNGLSIPLYIFHRIWRLTPLVMFTAALQVVVYRLGSGPYWDTGFGREIRFCQKNWWSTFLYVNNIVHAREMCMMWTWYLSADTQLYIVALIILLPIKRYPKTALGILALLAVLGVASSVASNIYLKLPADILSGASHIYEAIKLLAYAYLPTYQHLFGYAAGMASGYVLYHRSKFHISTKTNTACWSLACVFAAISIYSSYALYFIPEPPLPAAALYQPVCGVLWAVALAWLTISCFTGHGGFVNNFLSWRPLGPLSRLTFSVYLVHPIILYAYVYSTRFPIQSDHRTFVFIYLGIVLASYIVGYFMTMLFEAPFMALEKILLRKPGPEKTVNNFTVEDQLHMQKVSGKDCMEDHVQEKEADAGKTATLSVE